MATVRATVEIFGQRDWVCVRMGTRRGLRGDWRDFVDTRMREVADRSSSVDTVKIAVLTALNIADELFQERETDQDARQERLEEQAERLVIRDRRGHENPGIPGKQRYGLGGPCAVSDE